MADIAESLFARLKIKAKESGRNYQLCLRLFCQEEFLRRLEKSQYGEFLLWLESRMREYRLVLNLVWVMLSCRSRKNEKFPLSLMVLPNQK